MGDDIAYHESSNDPVENAVPVAKALLVGGEGNKILDSPRDGGTKEGEDDSSSRTSSNGNVEIDLVSDLGTRLRRYDGGHNGEEQKDDGLLHVV